MRTVVVESPFKATAERSQEQHELYLEHAMADCVARGESPYASHHYLTKVFDDSDPVERAKGLKAGWAIGDKLDACVVYSDLSVSPGMSQSIDHYRGLGKSVEWRRLDALLVRSILEM